MDFTFTDVELELRDTVASVLDRRCDRRHLDQSAGGNATPRDLWSSLGRLGLVQALVPADAGGLGLDERSVVMIFEEAGRHALPEPLAETMIAMPLLVGRDAPAGPEAPPFPMVSTDLGGPLIPWAEEADLLLLQGAGRSLQVADASACQLEPVPTVDPTRRAARLVSVAHTRALAVEPEEVERASARGVMAAAATLVGLGQAMLDLTVSYVSQREQFGVKVGSFQAVKHHLAGAAVQLEFTRPAVYRSAWSLAVGSKDAARDVSMAKAMAAEAADRVGRACLQCHGAVGYTTEYDLHLFLKRSWALARSWGTAGEHRAVVGGFLGLG